MYGLMEMMQQLVSGELSWAGLALKYACTGRPFPTRQELGLGLQRRRMAWLHVQEAVEAADAAFFQEEAALFPREALATMRAFWTQECLASAEPEVRESVERLLLADDEQVLAQCMRVNQDFLALTLVEEQIHAIWEPSRVCSLRTRWNSFMTDWRGKYNMSMRGQRAQKVLDVLSSVTAPLSSEELSPIQAELHVYMGKRVSPWVSELFTLALKGVDQAFDWLCGEYLFSDQRPGAAAQRLQESVELSQAGRLRQDDPSRIPISLLEKRLGALAERYGDAYKRANTSGPYRWCWGDDDMKTLCQALVPSQEDSLIREMALRVFEAMGIDVAAPADLVLKRDVGRYATEEHRSSIFSPGHCYFYRLPHESDLYLLFVIPDDRFKRFRHPGQVYLVGWPLSQAREEAEKLLHPGLVCFGSGYTGVVDEERFELNNASDQHDPRAFWHIIGDEGLQKVAAHLELRKQFLALSPT